MITDKFLEVLKHEGAAAIATIGEGEVHLANTWNSYIQITEDGRLLFPAGGMNVTEANVLKNNKVQMSVGSREVMGFHSPGTGFRISGTAAFLNSGSEFDEMKQRFPWCRAVVEITIQDVTQML